MTSNPKFKWINRKKKSRTPINNKVNNNANNSGTKLHGFYGFKMYFVNDDSINISTTLNNTLAFQRYIERNNAQFSLSQIKSNKVFFIDLMQLEQDHEFISEWLEFKNEILTNTEYCLDCLGLAMHQTIMTLERDDSVHILQIYARITNHKPILNLKNLKANYFGKLVSVRGTVIKASNIKFLCKCMAFMCSKCSNTQIIKLRLGVLSMPISCPTKGCRAKSNFLPVLTSETTETVNWQTLKLQELMEYDIGENGRVPRAIECELTEDLVGCCIPGDDITIVGVVKVRNEADVRQNKNQGAVFSLYMNVISVVNNKNQNEAVGDRIIFNTNDYYAIQQIHAEPQLFRFLVHSLCPHIYGNEIVKAGILITLFGGTQSNKGDITTRAVSHTLIVGDPGLGKSKLLQACTNVAPKGVYVCGTTSTSAGLTVTMTKESNGDYSLEAGALILADQGTCCIDEFDKMTSQHSHLLEAMEQQSISIAKAGITCNLPARTSIIAAANPCSGHYNKSKTVSENIKMNSPLLSRFDLVFLLLDQPCEKYDGLLSEHILALHSGKQKKSVVALNTSITSNLASNNKLQNRLKLTENEDIDYLPPQLLRKYIAYAQKYVLPTVSNEAQDILRQFYLKLRSQCKIKSSCSPVTARQLESLLRLTQARAKVELREEATAEDASDVLEIIRYSFLDIFTDKTGTIDFGRSQNGTGLSKQGQVKKLLMVLQQQAESLSQSTFSQKDIQAMAEQIGIDQKRFYEVLQKLNMHGYLLKKPGSNYQLTSVDF